LNKSRKSLFYWLKKGLVLLANISGLEGFGELSVLCDAIIISPVSIASTEEVGIHDISIAFVPLNIITEVIERPIVLVIVEDMEIINTDNELNISLSLHERKNETTMLERIIDIAATEREPQFEIKERLLVLEVF
jgi:hypothetical protein